MRHMLPTHDPDLIAPLPGNFSSLARLIAFQCSKGGIPHINNSMPLWLVNYQEWGDWMQREHPEVISPLLPQLTASQDYYTVFNGEPILSVFFGMLNRTLYPDNRYLRDNIAVELCPLTANEKNHRMLQNDMGFERGLIGIADSLLTTRSHGVMTMRDYAERFIRQPLELALSPAY